MGRIALTDDQRRTNDALDLGSQIVEELDVFAARRGRMNRKEFSLYTETPQDTLYGWRVHRFQQTKLRDLMDVLQRCGMTLQLMTAEQAKAWRKEHRE